VGKREGVYRVLVGKPEGKRTLENLGAVGSIILKYIFRKWNGGTDWIYLTQSWDRWRALANAEMDVRIP
jgi:hypothetical protein